jgi:hypothetical protein
MLTESSYHVISIRNKHITKGLFINDLSWEALAYSLKEPLNMNGLKALQDGLRTAVVFISGFNFFSETRV